MKTLSHKQIQILEFMYRFVDEKGYPPSIRDIEGGVGISSTSVVHYNLKILERGGYVRRDPEVSRGIELIDTSQRRAGIVQVPIIGYIAAGEPIPVPTSDTWTMVDAAETIEVTEDITQNKEEIYALRVRGTSMIDALINDGDIVLMQQVNTADNGEMVAVWLKEEKEATLKRVYREPDRIRLQPANVQMQPIYVDPEDVEIQGKVIAVIRHL
jgi:repressor LexA